MWFKGIKILGLSLMVVAFQNCEIKDMAMGQDPFTYTEPEILLDNSLDGVSSIELMPEASPASFHLKLNLTDGTLVYGSTDPRVGAPVQLNCLPADKFAQLKVYLSETPVCHFPGSDHMEGIACTMDYTYPYAALILDNGEEISLGKKTSGCSSTNDFCGFKTSEIKSLLKEIKTDFNTYTCSNP